MDLATVFGLVAGFGLVATAVAMGGSVAAFFDLPSLLIVLGGTLAVTMTCFSASEFFKTPQVLLRAVFFKMADPAYEARVILEFSQKARAKGLLSMQKDLKIISDDYLRQCLSMAVDGVDADAIETTMRNDTNSMLERHQQGISILRKAGDVAPAMGLIGTLIGLVQMLGNLSNPAAIGPAMAVALLTTFYGAVLANMVLVPLANKLERNSNAEYLLRRLYHVGVVSISKQENPRHLEVMLNTILPPTQRISVFE